MSNILEEYLVRIGAEVDRDAFRGAAAAINQLSGVLGKLSSVLKYGGIFVALAKVTESVVDNVRAVAKADLEYQKLAQSMWVTKDTAKSLSVILKTMGASQEDIAWVPELREQFLRLRNEMAALSTPGDAEGQLRWIRDIGYDVESLQLKLKMLKEWIVYYLIKELKPYIKQLQEFLGWLNDKIGKNLPVIAKKVAKALAYIVRVAMALVRGLKWVFEGIYNFIDSLPSKTKQLVAVFAAVGAAIMAGPFGIMMLGIGTALVMLEDFFGYLDGRESSVTLKPLWKWLTDENNPFKKTLETIKKAIGDIVERLSDLVNKIFTEDVRKALVSTLKEIANAVIKVAGGVASICSDLTKNSKNVNTFWDNFADGVQKAIIKTSRLGRVIAKLFAAMGEAMQGNWKAAKMELIGAALEAGMLFTDFAKGLGVTSGFGDSSGIAIQGENAEKAVKFFMSNGYTREQAIGIVSNLMAESGVNPLARSENDAGPGMDSFGIAQWNRERLENLKTFAENRGLDYKELDTQLAFFLWELENTHSYANSRLKRSSTAEEAADAIARYYEVPENVEVRSRERQSAARDYMNGAGALISPTSYAAGMAIGGANGILPVAAGTSTYHGGIINIGDIVVNCGNSSDPRAIGVAVASAVQDSASRLPAFTGGAIFT